MKLIEFKGLPKEWKNVYKRQVLQETDFTGAVIGERIVVTPELETVKEYCNTYTFPVDKINCLKIDEKETVIKFYINDIEVTEKTFYDVKSALEQA